MTHFDIALLLVLVLVLPAYPAFALYDGYDNQNPHLPKNDKEKQLLNDGFTKHSYSILPYGFQNYFVKVDPVLAIGEIGNSPCALFASFPIHFGDTAHVTMKFPNELEWAGGYPDSTFFIVKGGPFSYSDSFGNITSTNEPLTFHPINPMRDSSYITVDVTMEGGLNHLIINSTNFFEQDNHTPIPCKLTFEKPKSLDYYDNVFPVSQQIEFLRMYGFPPDSFVCKSGLEGVIKESNQMPACVKPQTKEKLVERGWAMNNFTDHKPELGIPPNVGPLAGVHEHASILVPIFGDNLDFSKNMFQIKNPYMHFEGNDGTTIHKHAENVTLGFLFETLNMKLTDDCLTIPDGRYFCNEETDGFSLKFYINGQKVESLSEYVLSDRDRILISYGLEDDKQISSQLDELYSQRIVS